MKNTIWIKYILISLLWGIFASYMTTYKLLFSEDSFGFRYSYIAFYVFLIVYGLVFYFILKYVYINKIKEIVEKSKLNEKINIFLDSLTRYIFIVDLVLLIVYILSRVLHYNSIYDFNEVTGSKARLLSFIFILGVAITFIITINQISKKLNVKPAQKNISKSLVKRSIWLFIILFIVSFILDFSLSVIYGTVDTFMHGL